MATPRTTVSGALAAAARERAAGLDPLAAAAEISAWVHQHVTYMPGSTGVQTGAQEAFDQGQGVCQDIAHLTVALLRVAGSGPVRVRLPVSQARRGAGRGGQRAIARLGGVLDR